MSLYEMDILKRDIDEIIKIDFLSYETSVAGMSGVMNSNGK